MFKAKSIEIDAAHQLVAVLNSKDAKELGISPGERVKISSEKSGKSIICQLEIIDHDWKKKTNCPIMEGEIGFFEHAFEKLQIWENQRVNIIPAPKPSSLEFVRKKFMGTRLAEEDFFQIMQDIVSNSYSEVETTYFVLACTIHQLNDKETIGLTKAMVAVGKHLDFKKTFKNIIVDKHCIGGIPANRTTMIIVPIIAAAGLKIPKTSSRSITSPAGTADTMEVLAKVNLPLSKMYSIVNEHNGCIVWGGGLDLSPADDIIIQVEHPLELDSEGQMIASILSKKKSAGSTHVLIDIPVGKTAKISDISHAKKLKKRFEKIANAIGIDVEVIITNGNEPVGTGIGPLHEALDVMKVLENDETASSILREKSLLMAGKILEMAQVSKKGQGYLLATEILESKRALKKFNDIVKAQGKNENVEMPKYSYEIKADHHGIVNSIDNKYISKLAFVLGAPQDKTAGLVLSKKIGDRVEKGEIILTLYSSSELKLKYGKHFFSENNFMIYVK